MIISFAIVVSSVALVVPLALVGWGRVLARRTGKASLSDASFHATVILREIQSPVHHMMQRDPDYRRNLFNRYAPLLLKDMALVTRCGGFHPRLLFWHWLFRLYYRLLGMQRLPVVLGLEPAGLAILVAALLPLLNPGRSAA